MESLPDETLNQSQPENPLSTEKEESRVEGVKNMSLEENRRNSYGDDNKSREDLQVELQIGECYQYPLRPHAEDCSFYLKTGKCKFGVNCKFNHPLQISVENYPDTKRSLDALKSLELPPPPELNCLGLPIRMMEKDCSYYMRTGTCAYGSTCIFNHPHTSASAAQKSKTFTSNTSGFGGHLSSGNYNGESHASDCKFHHPKARPWNSKPIGFTSAGLPIRRGTKICWSYEKIGICKYGRSCCFHHPEEFDDSL